MEFAKITVGSDVSPLSRDEKINWSRENQTFFFWVTTSTPMREHREVSTYLDLQFDQLYIYIIRNGMPAAVPA